MLLFKTILVISIHTSLATAQAAVTVSVGSTLQEIDGFGVSQAFGRAAEFRDLMPEGPRSRALDYLFSTTSGAGLTIIRNRVGSGGRGDSILPLNPGGPGSPPNYVWDNDDKGQVWLSQQAASYGIKTFYANAWSAPGFMKTNGNEANGGYLCGTTGHTCSSGDWRQAYADLFVKYIQYYGQLGINITHVGFLNEPDYVTSYSSMQSSAREASSFIPILHGALQGAGLASQVKITCCDALGWPSARTFTSGLVSAGMEQFLGVMSSHMYSGDPGSPPLSTRLKTWQTEGCDLNSAWCTTWYANGGLCEGLTWAGKIAQGMLSANLSAYIYWQGAEVNQFQASSYLVASDGTNVYPSGRLWAFAMWSRFVRPGAYRLSTAGTISGVQYGAFRNTDQSVVIVFTNMGSGAQSTRVSFNNFSPEVATAYITDNTRAVASTAATLSGGVLTISLPGRSVVTVKLSSGQGHDQ